MPQRLSKRAPAVLVGLIAALLLVASPAAAAPGVVQNLAGCRAHQVAATDDGSSDAVALGFTAHIYDGTFTQAYVNNNGNITFDAKLAKYTPFDFRESGAPSIDPFFADVDTTGAASGLTNYGTVTYGGHPAFCVIWDHVGYFLGHADKTNTFQAILVDQGSAGVDIVFNYDHLSWETGDVSGGTNGFGGTSAVAGYAAGDGDGSHALILPGSFANGGLLDSSPSTGLAGHGTAGQPAGRYVFQVRLGAPTGGRVFGTVTDNDDATVAGALVQLCPASGTCFTRTTDASGNYRASSLPAGTYRVTGFPGPGGAFSSTSYDNVTVGAPGTQTQRNIKLGPQPSPPPDGTAVSPRIDGNPGGVPSTSWSRPAAPLDPGLHGWHRHLHDGPRRPDRPYGRDGRRSRGDLRGRRRGAGARSRNGRGPHPRRLPRRDARRRRRLRDLRRSEWCRARRGRPPGSRRPGDALSLGERRGPVLRGARRQPRDVTVEPQQPRLHRRLRPLRLGRRGRVLRRGGCGRRLQREVARAEHPAAGDQPGPPALVRVGSATRPRPGRQAAGADAPEGQAEAEAEAAQARQDRQGQAASRARRLW